MAQPPPTPTGWYPAPAPQRRAPDTWIIGLVVAVVFILVLFSIIAIFLSGPAGAIPILAFAPFMCFPFLFVIIFIIIALASGSRRRTIPPPPPIQQPMVPAGQQGPVALDCPNCGGPPTNVDRFGIATCSYCGTRFLVR